MSVHVSGNAYVTGAAASPNLATTPGAFQPVSRGLDAFVLKLNAAGNQVVYSTFIGGTGPACVGGSRCSGFEGTFYADLDAGHAIAVDAAGNAYVAGETNAQDFPVTAGAFQRDCPPLSTCAWVAKLNPFGS